MASKLHESLKVPIRGGVKPPPELVLGTPMDLKGSEEGSAAVQRQSVDSKGAEKGPVEGPVRENGDEIHVHIEEHTINQKVKFEPTHEKTNNVISEQV